MRELNISCRQLLRPQLAEDVREEDDARLPEDEQAHQRAVRQQSPALEANRRRFPGTDWPLEDIERHSVHSDGEEVVKEDEGLADEAGEEADGAGDAGAAELEVAEAAVLQGTEGVIWRILLDLLTRRKEEGGG